MKQVSRKQYAIIHTWLNNTFGKAVACENLKCEKNSVNFQYALRAGKTHKKLRGNNKVNESFEKHLVLVGDFSSRH